MQSVVYQVYANPNLNLLNRKGYLSAMLIDAQLRELEGLVARSVLRRGCASCLDANGSDSACHALLSTQPRGPWQLHFFPWRIRLQIGIVCLLMAAEVSAAIGFDATCLNRA